MYAVFSEYSRAKGSAAEVTAEKAFFLRVLPDRLPGPATGPAEGQDREVLCRLSRSRQADGST